MKRLSLLANRKGDLFCVALALMIIFTGTISPLIYAIDNNDLGSITNNTPFYDPNAADQAPPACSSIIGGTTSQNESAVYNFLVTKGGMQPFQAAGLMGNMKAEAHFEPRLVEYGFKNSRGEVSAAGQPSSLDDNVPPNEPSSPQGQPGYGLIQWTGGRKQPLRDLAASTGLKGGDLGLQLQNLMRELQGPYKGSTYDPLLASTTVEQATDIVLTHYEIPGDIPGQRPVRTAFAQEILTQYGSTTPPAADPSATPITTPLSSSCGGGASGVSGYQNPFRDVPNIAQAGIDAGVDYSGDGPVYAIGEGVLNGANPHSGWVGGNSVTYKLTSGAAAGKVIYVAENCTVNPLLTIGQKVDSSTILCVMHNAYPYIETGWAEDSDVGATPLAYVDHCYYITNPSLAKSSTAYGVNFDSLMTRLGAPKASLLAPPITCTLPSGWPTW